MSRKVQITSEIKRVRERVSEVERKLRTFVDTNPYKFEAKHNPESQKPIYYASRAILSRNLFRWLPVMPHRT
jgi:hypothetical protein